MFQVHACLNMVIDLISLFFCSPHLLIQLDWYLGNIGFQLHMYIYMHVFQHIYMYVFHYIIELSCETINGLASLFQMLVFQIYPEINVDVYGNSPLEQIYLQVQQVETYCSVKSLLVGCNVASQMLQAMRLKLLLDNVFKQRSHSICWLIETILMIILILIIFSIFYSSPADCSWKQMEELEKMLVYQQISCPSQKSISMAYC